MALYGCFCPEHDLVTALPPEICCRSDGRAAPNAVWDLFALTTEGAARLCMTALRCRTLLVPEERYSSAWQVKQLVSYGLSSRSTLTLSSMGEHNVLCVQRRIYTCGGTVAEEGERFLPAAWNRWTPMEQLLLAGTWLLTKNDLPNL